MRKMAMAVGMLMLSSTCVFAMPDRVGKTDMGFQIGGLLPASGSIDDAAHFGGSLSYGVNDWFAMGIEGGYSDSRTSFNIGDSVRQAHITRVPFFFDLIARYTKLSDYNYVPYGVLGLGAVFGDTRAQGAFASSGLELNVSDAFAIKIGAGVDWFMTDQWILNLEASYVWVNEDAKVTRLSDGAEVDSADSSYWMIGGGAKYLFE